MRLGPGTLTELEKNWHSRSTSLTGIMPLLPSARRIHHRLLPSLWQRWFLSSTFAKEPLRWELFASFCNCSADGFTSSSPVATDRITLKRAASKRCEMLRASVV